MCTIHRCFLICVLEIMYFTCFIFSCGISVCRCVSLVENSCRTNCKICNYSRKFPLRCVYVYLHNVTWETTRFSTDLCTILLLNPVGVIPMCFTSCSHMFLCCMSDMFLCCMSDMFLCCMSDMFLCCMSGMLLRRLSARCVRECERSSL